MDEMSPIAARTENTVRNTGRAMGEVVDLGVQLEMVVLMMEEAWTVFRMDDSELLIMD